jgi:hypothetical protein
MPLYAGMLLTSKRSVVLTAVMTVFIVYSLLPLVWLFISSTKTQRSLLNSFGLWFDGPFAFFDNVWQTLTHDDGIFLTWFAARDPRQFVPEAFPIFIRITRERSMYGAPTIDGSTVKATLDGRGAVVADGDTIARDLTPAEVAESHETVREFFPGLIPEIVRSDAYPDLYTSDSTGLLGRVPGSERIYCATGFSGAG